MRDLFDLQRHQCAAAAASLRAAAEASAVAFVNSGCQVWLDDPATLLRRDIHAEWRGLMEAAASRALDAVQEQLADLRISDDRGEETDIEAHEDLLAASVEPALPTPEQLHSVHESSLQRILSTQEHLARQAVHLHGQRTMRVVREAALEVRTSFAQDAAESVPSVESALERFHELCLERRRACDDELESSFPSAVRESTQRHNPNMKMVIDEDKTNLDESVATEAAALKAQCTVDAETAQRARDALAAHQAELAQLQAADALEAEEQRIREGLRATRAAWSRTVQEASDAAVQGMDTRHENCVSITMRVTQQRLKVALAETSEMQCSSRLLSRIAEASPQFRARIDEFPNQLEVSGDTQPTMKAVVAVRKEMRGARFLRRASTV